MVTQPEIVWVVKRGGSVERYDVAKLSGAMWRAMSSIGQYSNCLNLAGAIEFFMNQTGRTCVSSGVVFEMAIRVLRRAGFEETAGIMETWHALRQGRRRKLCVIYSDGRCAGWDKSWLCEFIRRSWHISPATSRIIASNVENNILAMEKTSIDRGKVVEMLNDQVAQWGLADAVPMTVGSE